MGAGSPGKWPQPACVCGLVRNRDTTVYGKTVLGALDTPYPAQGKKTEHGSITSSGITSLLDSSH